MADFKIRSLTPDDTGQVFALQQAYAAVFPGAPVFPGEMYLSPVFRGGEDVFCALRGGQVIAYAPVYIPSMEVVPPGTPLDIWTEIRADPRVTDAELVKEALYGCVMQRIQERSGEWAGHPARVMFEYHANEAPSIAFVQARGFTYRESVFLMRRDLRQPAPDLAAPSGITIRRWRMESEAEQQAYVDARNACFPQLPISLGHWQHYLSSPMWAAGTMVAAFDAARLVGAVNVYWSEDENQPAGTRAGSTEDIFVLPGWRGKGIARAMIAEGMRYLQEHGLEEACLAVRALNSSALALYQSLGYQVMEESQFYGKDL